MDKLITAVPIAGDSVYGVRQVQYTVDRVPGRNFADAVTVAAFKQAAAIESTTSAYVKVVKARQQKIDELGEALSYIAKAMGWINKKTKSSDEFTIDNASYVKEIAAKYEVSLSWNGTNTMKLGNLQKAQTSLQYAIDREDNDIQQDIVTLQSYISKRDNAYSNAAKIVKKTNQAATSTIGNIGD